MKKLSGFSLMEMMVVLLIVAIVAAASAPMINKKMVSAAGDKSPWVWVGTNHSIAYNLGGSDVQTATIGAVTTPSEASGSRLYIDSKKGSDGNFKPQITFSHNGTDSDVMKLISAKNNIWFSNKSTNFNNTQNSVVLGANSSSSNWNAVVIGSNCYAQGVSSVAIGNNIDLRSSTEQVIAIGSEPKVKGACSISIGTNSNAAGYNSTAIGRHSQSDGNFTTSIGYFANATGMNSLAIGPVSNVSSTNALAIGSFARSGMPRSIAIGQNAFVSTGNSLQARAIAIGYNAVSNKSDSIAIGGRYGANATRATGTGAIAIGSTTQASGNCSIAIGGTANMTTNVDTGSATTTRAIATNAIAIGAQANAAYTNSVAIGRDARTTSANQIVLGTTNDTVLIPGTLNLPNTTLRVKNLIVSNWAEIGESLPNNRCALKVRTGHYHPETGADLKYGHQRDGQFAYLYSCKYDNGYLAVSDRRLKNVGNISKAGLEKIRQLKVFNYTFKKDPDKRPHVGVIAQDLQKIFPNAVTKGEDGFLEIRWDDMFYALINAVKENDSRITALEKENIELKKQNMEFQKRLTELEKKVK